MALTVTCDLSSTVITTSETITGWFAIGAQSPALEPDFFVQGGNCISRAVSNATKGMVFDFGSGIDFTASTHKDKLVYIWMRVNTPQLVAAQSASGVVVRLCTTSATADYREWKVDGNDTIPETDGWICYVIDPQSAGSTTSGSYSAASVRFFGGAITTTTTAKGQNFGIDQISIGRGEVYVSGTVATAGQGFKEIADVVYDSAKTNRWGVITVKNGILYVKGKIIIGHATADTTFSSRGETVVWETPGYYNASAAIVKTIPDASVGGTAGTDGRTTYNGLAFQGGSGTTNIDLGVIVGTDSGRSGSSLICAINNTLAAPGVTKAGIVMSDSTVGLSVYATTFTGFEDIVDLYGTGVDDDDCFASTFNGCARLRTNMELRKCNILNSVSAVDDGAMLWESTTNIEDCLFANNSRGVVFESNTGTPFAFTKMIFSNNTFDVRNESGAAITINVSEGSTPTYEDIGGGSATTVSNPVTYTLTGLVSGTEVRIFRISDGVELGGVESSSTSFAHAYTYDGDTAIKIIIQKTNYEWLRLNDTLTNGDKSVAISQRPDRNYVNQ